MTRQPSPYSRPSVLLADFLITAVGFGGALALYSRYVYVGSFLDLLPGVTVSAVVFWISIQLSDRARPQSAGALFLQQFCLGAGLGLMPQALFSYVRVIRRMPILTVFGSLVAAALVTLATRLFYERRAARRDTVLLVGDNPVWAGMLAGAHRPLAGYVGPPADAPPGVAHLGELDELPRIVEASRPGEILIGLRGDWRERIPPALLLDYRMAGVVLTDVAHAYEEWLHRVPIGCLRPGDLVLSPALRADRRTMAAQAVYTNLIGLVLLLMLSPVLAVLAVAVRLFSGRGPTFESIPCLGFQKIPFGLLRFRTYRCDGSGATTWIGRQLIRLHLLNLPQVINIVRGDMALFGPRAVRCEFAQRLTELMPFYSHRFSVKPGILGWAQAHLRKSRHVPSEAMQIEYDFYYIKAASTLLDVDILLRELFGGSGAAAGE